MGLQICRCMNWDDLRFFLSVARAGQIGRAAPALRADPTTVSRRIRRLESSLKQVLFEQDRDGQKLTAAGRALLLRAEDMERCASAIGEEGREGRSEEHTSELQSLMRISYAVFCLKKKNKKITQIT